MIESDDDIINYCIDLDEEAIEEQKLSSFYENNNNKYYNDNNSSINIDIIHPKIPSIRLNGMILLTT